MATTTTAKRIAELEAKLAAAEEALQGKVKIEAGDYAKVDGKHKFEAHKNGSLIRVTGCGKPVVRGRNFWASVHKRADEFAKLGVEI